MVALGKVRQLFGVKAGLCAVIGAGLLGCTGQIVGNPNNAAGDTAGTERCCTTAERFPAALVAKVDARADDKAMFTTSARLRPAFLGDRPEAWAYIQRHLRPMDILTSADKGVMSRRLMPGFFSHSLVYLGTEDQLRAEGLWDLPALVPHHARIRSGDVFYEAIPDEVGFARAEDVFDVDAIGVYRSDLTGPEKAVALTRLLSRLGTPFDRHFDSGTPECLYCAELIVFGFGDLGLSSQQVYGREVFQPDSFAQTALSGEGRLRLVGFVYGSRKEVRSGGADVLAATLRRYWR